ncbi:uncharacterized protein B0I36DRAFT_87207 [Microdochium trichocladiopsis]|uniref:CAP-Gly domain-containing protein n=1 Tax=Microdochium trichocladiopsis TaxID=1682393 RepID=A0A9P9BT20_9PEZI|nr:uncharacterized protein B0I36DRAFT_87207 [Microdochium trichocladiopsis]KAH7035042.1 hypothetical protein B0I36DRAFT_87207 [Microdochium trichocladiopsis]
MASALPQQQQHSLSRTPRKPASGAASTPNLNSLYSAHGSRTPSLSRKNSCAGLAPIPDSADLDALHNILRESSSLYNRMGPITPGRAAAAAAMDDFREGDIVDVPGNMAGTVRFVGSVGGRKGTFAGIELHPEFSARGKNSGDVDGVQYFTTSAPGAGIFVPVGKLFKREPGPNSTIPSTPTSGSVSAFKLSLRGPSSNTPPTPGLPKFSQSVGPGRAPSPSNRKPRASVHRPESPVRRLQMSPGSRPSIMATPGPRAPQRYGTPTISKFSQSVRGTAGDPAKAGPRTDRKPSLVPRSASALGSRSSSALGQVPDFDEEEETTPNAVTRNQAFGSVRSISSLNFKRPASRTTHVNEEEIERLRTQLEDRDRQLKDQASTLAEMESSLTELTELIGQNDLTSPRPNSIDGKDTSQLRAMLREKNEKIAMLTAEFDAHRADFRSTIDTLEMASTETQRVYDARIRELEEEIHGFQDRTDDFDSVARQLKQLEELVQELEEGLEDARRGEAEARGEVEFLRGEVERTRAELRREQEKASAANGDKAGGAKPSSSVSKELEQKEDEIRGLKAIIHSLSRDSVPGAETSPTADRSSVQSQRPNSFAKSRPESMGARMAKEKLEREVSELRGLLDTKSVREEELERELATLRRGSASTQRGSTMTLGSAGRSSFRDSKSTVILARDPASPPKSGHHRNNTLESVADMDNFSSVTENSTLWCEICETAGHDILTCTNVFGPQQDQNGVTGDGANDKSPIDSSRPTLTIPGEMNEEDRPRPLTPIKRSPAPAAEAEPMSPPKVAEPAQADPTSVQSGPPPGIRILPNPADTGPLAGKDSGTIDPEKWCALCERDGHDSIDCPFEDAF